MIIQRTTTRPQPTGGPEQTARSGQTMTVCVVAASHRRTDTDCQPTHRTRNGMAGSRWYWLKAEYCPPSAGFPADARAKHWGIGTLQHSFTWNGMAAKRWPRTTLDIL
jgi:hypothetical protein